ncbi:putative plant seed peroxygenase [Helianthus annuus]|nr:putative plant seed peroxygenase [Helianthus annuus]
MKTAIDNNQNVLQKHVEFFDRNKDGVIYPWETFQVEKTTILCICFVLMMIGFRAIGSGIVLSSVAAIFINAGLSGKTRPISEWLSIIQV